MGVENCYTTLVMWWTLRLSRSGGVMQIEFNMFRNGSAALSDEWSGVSNGAESADGRGKLLPYFGHVVGSSIVNTCGSC